eukprot:3734304-Amphidinium_carterae.4
MMWVMGPVCYRCCIMCKPPPVCCMSIQESVYETQRQLPLGPMHLENQNAANQVNHQNANHQISQKGSASKRAASSGSACMSERIWSLCLPCSKPRGQQHPMSPFLRRDFS